MNNRPDLPALESVKTARSYRITAMYQALVPVLQACLIVSVFAGAYALSNLKPREIELPLAGVLCMMGIGVVIWFANTLRADFYWETSPQSLLARGFFRHRTVEWGEIQSVQARESRYGSGQVLLGSENGQFVVPKGDDQPEIVLSASIWQHLRRSHGDAGYELSPDSQSLWCAIPESIPRTVQWVNPNPPRMTHIYVIASLVCFLFLAEWFWDNSSIHFRSASTNWIPLFSALIGLYGFFLAPKLRTARRVSLRENALVAEIARKTVTINLSNVNTANWWDNEALVIWEGRTNIRLPFNTSDSLSGKLILAITRQLRELDTPFLVPIPEAVLACEPPSPEL